MRSMSVLTLWLSLTSMPAAAGKEPLGLDDLKILADKESFTELVEHIDDVPPTKRDDTWSALLIKGAIGYLGSLAGEEDGRNVPPTANALLKRFPELKKNALFMQQRATLGLAWFAKCFQDSWAADRCHKDLTEFVAADPKSYDLALKAGKLACQHGNPGIAIGYFEKAIALRKGDRVCTDADLATSVLVALRMPSDTPEMKLGIKVAGICYTSLKTQLADELAEQGTESAFFANACPLVKAHGDLKGLKAKRCKG